jgi:hypothetical protein
MNKKTKTWFGIFISVTLIVIVAFLVMSVKIRNLRNENQLKAVELASKNDSIKIYRTKAGEIYGKFTAIEIERTNLKKSLDILAIQIKDLKDRDIKWQNLVSVLKLKIQSSGQIITVVKDSIIYIPGKPQENLQVINPWTNGYLSLNGYIKDHKFNGSYLYTTNLVVPTAKKVGKSYITTVSLSDPEATILEGSQIVITPTKRWHHNPWIYRGLSFIAGFYLGSR